MTAETRPVTSTAPFAMPTRPVSGLWITLFATAWFGIWMAQLTPIQLLLPEQVASQLTSSYWIDSVMAFGVISGIAGVCTLIAYPLTGALSDRTVSRYGRRRPWILGGTLLFAISLFLLGLQNTMVGTGVFWSLSLVGFCVVSAAITAMISDQVPVRQRGTVSGWVSAPQAIGTVVGLVLVMLPLFTGQFRGYTLVAVLLVVLVLPFLLWVPDEVLAREQRGSALTVQALLQGFWISPRQHPDFGWTLLSRVLVNLSNALGTTLLLYFLMFGLRREATAEDDLLTVTVVYLVVFIAAALIFGKLSDRVGKRRPFVYLASYIQALAALLLALLPSYPMLFVAAGLLGLGYGCYMAVDQALATQVLPDEHTRGKDLGIMNIAMAFPQAIAPLLGALVVAYFAGFQGLFILAACAALLGGIAVIPIRSVR
ncbi:MFS transporter [Glaciihabitans sp. dw_435]|uniref:MFS transporter n=1 Tax=Glaciihabitans sp. dw_435 TaxID=2720081 RepID=UPI001BD28D37|nr:MFS transporter [Glaciihabitans sp. dw_435]